MAIFQTPPPEEIDLVVVSLIYKQREQLRFLTQSNPKRWTGSLRKSALARAVQSSNSIEGYHATADQAMAVVENEAPPQEGYSETWLAIKGYRDALTYIMQAATDPHFEFSKQFLKSLHFMMVGHEMEKYPGQWRPGKVFVVNSQTGDAVYDAPEVEDVNGLVEELVHYLKFDERDTSIVRGAMAHLNLTMIHPFKDGNGRMARALQTLLIARDGLVHPAFSSIEEWLGDNTQEYYQVLAEVGQGRWNPERSALPWVRFCLKAHYQQGQKIIRRNEEYGVIFEKIRELVTRHKLPERMEIPLFDVCLGMRMTNSRYRVETNVTEYVASRDLKRLSELGLLDPQGEARGRWYGPSPTLEGIWRTSRISRVLEDPYQVAAAMIDAGHKGDQPRLPGV